jgi:hypothetical protein
VTIYDTDAPTPMRRHRCANTAKSSLLEKIRRNCGVIVVWRDGLKALPNEPLLHIQDIQVQYLDLRILLLHFSAIETAFLGIGNEEPTPTSPSRGILSPRYLDVGDFGAARAYLKGRSLAKNVRRRWPLLSWLSGSFSYFGEV